MLGLECWDTSWGQVAGRSRRSRIAPRQQTGHLLAFSKPLTDSNRRPLSLPSRLVSVGLCVFGALVDRFLEMPWAALRSPVPVPKTCPQTVRLLANAPW